MRSIDPVEFVEDEKSQPRNLCPIWRSEKDMPDAAKVLYKKAAELAAIPLQTVIRGATQVERQLELWCIQKAKGKTTGNGKGKGKGRVDIEAVDDMLWLDITQSIWSRRNSHQTHTVWIPDIHLNIDKWE